jgi:hypothetical protein
MRYVLTRGNSSKDREFIYQKAINRFEGEIGIYSRMSRMIVMNSQRKIQKIEYTATPVELNSFSESKLTLSCLNVLCIVINISI